MIIERKIENDRLTISPMGRLDSATGDEFKAAIDENLTGEIKTLVIDFGGVDFISSKALRVIVSVYKSLCDRKMEFVGANASVKEVFRVSGLLKIFDVQ